MPLYGISPGACTENLIQAGIESLMPEGESIRIYKYRQFRYTMENQKKKKKKKN